MEHSFDTKFAEEHGVEAAILFKNIHFWILKNRANRKHYYDGKYWTYNTVNAWHELFPYMTKDVIRRRLDYLIDKGILIKGFFNKDPRDRTRWLTIGFYSFMDLAAGTNENVSSAKSSIEHSDSKLTDSKHPSGDGHDNGLFSEKESDVSHDIIDHLNQTRKKYGIGGKTQWTKERTKMIRARIKASGATTADIKAMIEHIASQWKGTKFEKFVRIQTLFGDKFQDYMEQVGEQPKKGWMEQTTTSQTPDDYVDDNEKFFNRAKYVRGTE